MNPLRPHIENFSCYKSIRLDGVVLPGRFFFIFINTHETNCVFFHSVTVKKHTSFIFNECLKYASYLRSTHRRRKYYSNLLLIFKLKEEE